MAFILKWLPFVLLALAMGFVALFAANNVGAIGKLVAKVG